MKNLVQKVEDIAQEIIKQCGTEILSMSDDDDYDPVYILGGLLAHELAVMVGGLEKEAEIVRKRVKEFPFEDLNYDDTERLGEILSEVLSLHLHK